MPYFRYLKTLEFLDLSDNAITHSTVSFSKLALPHLCKLKFLDFSGNDIGCSAESTISKTLIETTAKHFHKKNGSYCWNIVLFDSALSIYSPVASKFHNFRLCLSGKNALAEVNDSIIRHGKSPASSF